MSTAQGVIGGKRLDIRDLRLVERAARESWAIGEALRDDVIDRLATIIRNPASSDRAITSAARALLGFSRTNLASIAQMLQVDRHVYGMHPPMFVDVIPPVASRHDEPPVVHSPDSSSFCPVPSSFSDSGSVTGVQPVFACPDSASFDPVPSSFSEDCDPIDPEPATVHSLPSTSPPASFTSPDSCSVFRVPSSISDSAPAPAPTPTATHARTATASDRKKSRAVSRPSSPLGHRPSDIGRPSSAISHRPSVIDHLPLEYVTHLELFAEDPSPTAPAIERTSKARVRLRVGKGVDVWVPPPTLIPRLPPCPERDLLLNHRLQICRVDDPSRYEPN